MRNPERIKLVLDLIGKIWETYPDMRFNQLLSLLQDKYAEEKDAHQETFWDKQEYNGIVTYQKTVIVELFYVEDELFIEFLQKEVDSCNK